MDLTRAQVLAYRVHAQQLDAPAGSVADVADVAALDLGVQDSGPDGAAWALELRGLADAASRADELVLAWTLRGAPHAYRRTQAADVATATAPVSERDAAKRIFDASRPLRASGIPVLEALDHVAAEMRSVVTAPTVKGDLSGALNDRLPEPYLRFCRPCDAVHLYEQPFRLAALRAGLELTWGTSPPVLRRIPGWGGPSRRVEPALDPVRGVLHLLGPATPQQVATFLDSPVADVKARWPTDAEPVGVDGQTRSALTSDLPALADPPATDGLVRLLGPFDLLLQGRDRELLVPDPARRSELWRTLGRPGAVLVGHEVRGAWRPRAAGRRLRLAVDAWGLLPDLSEQAERLAALRGVTFAGFVDA